MFAPVPSWVPWQSSRCPCGVGAYEITVNKTVTLWIGMTITWRISMKHTRTRFLYIPVFYHRLKTIVLNKRTWWWWWWWWLMMMTDRKHVQSIISGSRFLDCHHLEKLLLWRLKSKQRECDTCYSFYQRRTATVHVNSKFTEHWTSERGLEYKFCNITWLKLHTTIITLTTAMSHDSHSVGIYSIYSETTHNLATVVSAQPAPAACFYNPRMPIRACAVQYAFDAFINSEFGSRLKWQVWQLASCYG